MDKTQIMPKFTPGDIQRITDNLMSKITTYAAAYNTALGIKLALEFVNGLSNNVKKDKYDNLNYITDTKPKYKLEENQYIDD